MSHIPIACFCNPLSTESLEHLFFSCPLAQAVLSWLQSLMSRCSALISSLLCRHVLFGFNSDELCVVPRGFVYMRNVCKYFLWSAHNDYRFRDIVPSSGTVCSGVCSGSFSPSAALQAFAFVSLPLLFCSSVGCSWCCSFRTGWSVACSLVTLLFCFCILLMFLRCTLALLNCPWVYFGVVKLPFVFVCYVVSCNFGLLCCLLVVWHCWLGLSFSLPVLSPAGRGWCLVGDRLCISLLVYFGVV